MNQVKVDSDFVSLLCNKERPEVRGFSIQCVLDMTDSNDGIKVIGQNKDCLEAIVSCLKDEQPSFRPFAFKTLINLTAVDTILWRIMELPSCGNTILYSLNCALDKTDKNADLASKLLSNITRVEKCATKVFDIIIKNSEDCGFDRIINALCSKKYNIVASLDYLALLLGNLTQIKVARQFILDKERCIMQRLLPFVHFMDSEVRRHGIIAMIKNCCFETEFHDWLLSEKVDILPHLLLPLAGPETFDDDDMDRLPLDLQYLPPDKEREYNAQLRQMLVEAIFQLCATKSCRLFIKEKNTYIIIRELDIWETVDNMRKPIEDLIQILIGDEPNEELSNLHDVEIPEDIREQFKSQDLNAN